jgi:hypothetical protein
MNLNIHNTNTNTNRRFVAAAVVVAAAVALAPKPARASFEPCRTTLEQTLSYLKSKNPDQFAATTVADLKTIESLDLGDLGVTDEELVNLCPLVSLKNLALYNDFFDHSLTGVTLDRLSTLVNLETLDLDSNHISARELWRLAGLRKLKSIRLFNNPLGGAGIEALLLLPKLESLYVHADHLVDADLAHFAFLRFHPALNTLLLLGNEITDDGLVHLAGMHNIETLNLLGNQLTTGAGLKYVARMRGLRTLDVSNFRIFSSNKNVIEAKNIALLADAPVLESLNLAGLGLTDGDLVQVAKVRRLKVLSLGGNLITGDGLRALLAMDGLTRLTIPFAIDLTHPAIGELQAKFPGIVISNGF